MDVVIAEADLLKVVNVTQLESDTILVCFESKAVDTLLTSIVPQASVLVM